MTPFVISDDVSVGIPRVFRTIPGRNKKKADIKEKKNHNSKSLKMPPFLFFFLLLFQPDYCKVRRRFPPGWPFPGSVDWIIGLDTSREPSFSLLFISFSFRLYIFKGIPFFFSCFSVLLLYDGPCHLIQKSPLGTSSTGWDVTDDPATQIEKDTLLLWGVLMSRLSITRHRM